MNAVLRQTGAERWGCSVERDRIAHRHKTPTIANTHMLSARNLVLLCFALVLAACATIGLVSARADDPKPVDFSFSLTCRVLGSEAKKPLIITIQDYELARAKAIADGNWDEISKNPVYNGLVYDDSARVAYYHGKVDDASFAVLGGTYVKEVTPDMIYIESESLPKIGPGQIGSFDRRAGDGYLRYNQLIPDKDASDKNGWQWTLWREYRFDDCKPSPPAKF